MNVGRVQTAYRKHRRYPATVFIATYDTSVGFPKKITDCSRDSNDAFRKTYGEHFLCDYPCTARVFLLDRIGSNAGLSEGFGGRAHHIYLPFRSCPGMRVINLYRCEEELLKSFDGYSRGH